MAINLFRTPVPRSFFFFSLYINQLLSWWADLFLSSLWKIQLCNWTGLISHYVVDYICIPFVLAPFWPSCLHITPSLHPPRVKAVLWLSGVLDRPFHLDLPPHRSFISALTLSYPFSSLDPSEPHACRVARNGCLILLLFLVSVQWPWPYSSPGCLPYVRVQVLTFYWVRDIGWPGRWWRSSLNAPKEPGGGQSPGRIWAFHRGCQRDLSVERLNSLRIEESWFTLEFVSKWMFLREALCLLPIAA